VGRWWLDALEAHEVADLSQYVAGTNDEVSMSVACFANSSPGEVVSPAGKVVGLTQWRPREGALVSGVLTYLDSRDLARMVVGPSELVTQLQHPSQSSLDLATSVDGISRLVARHLDVAVTPRALS
jgi:hypothetical protein